MNKTLNTWLFMGAALVVNLILMFAWFLLLTGLGGVLFPLRPEWLSQVLWVVFFLLSLLGAFLTYLLIFRLVKKNLPLERWFDPLFLGSRWF